MSAPVPSRSPVLTERPDVDVLDPQFHVGDPHPAYRWMRANEPVFRDRNGIWLINRLDDIRHVERRAQEYVSSRGYRSVWFPQETSMISKDDPAHREQRALISDMFTPKAVAHWEPTLRADIVEALDLTTGCDRFDVVDAFAARIPAVMTCRLLGWPIAAWRDVRSWSERLMRVDTLFRDPSHLADANRAVREMAAATVPAVTERRDCPATDVLGRWANASLDGQPMSMADIISELGLVVPGGAETTRTTLGRALIMFSERNDLWERLAAEPDTIPLAVEELLRWVTPLNNMFRVADQAVVVNGVSIAAGERLALAYPSANRDEQWFPDPDEIDFSRNPNPHVAFGFGPHFCLGAHVARLVIRVALEELTRRFTNLRPGGPAHYEANVFVKAVERFDLVVDRR